MPLLAFQACESDLSVPLNTRRYESLPTYGSAIVLNTCAAGTPSEAVSVTSPPLALRAATPSRAAGEGGS